MSSSDFRFKKFTIRHEHATMKVGTDGVLLGAWVAVQEAKSILDIGTGSGLIALMLAQRTTENVLIDAVEIENHGADQAIDNIRQSPWPQKVNVHRCAIQHYYPEKKYDLIVSNPPYFQNSFKPPSEKRTQTRHTVTLSFPDLLGSALRLLAPDGKFNVIFPYTEGLEFIDLAKNSNIYCTRQWSLKTRKEKPVERWLLEFSPKYQAKEEGEVVLHDTGEMWSEAYKALTQDFYLKL